MLPSHHGRRNELSGALESVHRSKDQRGHADLVFIVKTANLGERTGGDRVGGAAKSAINAHVARLSHEKRRNQRAKHKETNSKHLWTSSIAPPPLSNSLPESGTLGTPQYEYHNISDSRTEPEGDRMGSQGVTKPFHRKDRNVFAHDSSRSRSESPRNMLQKGNSDPFDSLAIAIDAWANRFMDFGRNFLIPALYQSGKRGWVPSSPAARNWHAGIRDLSDQCAAYGLMAYYATALTIISGDASAARRALVLKTKAVELLRAQMSKYLENDLYIDTTIQGLIFRLFRAEILGRNPGAALVHGIMLRSGLERQAAAGTLDLGFLSVCIYHDNHRSTALMARPIFDYKGFVPKAFAAVWKNLPLSLSLDTRNLIGDPDDSLTDPLLWNILSEMRPFFVMYSLMATTRQTSATATNWFWFLSQSETFQGRLLNRYLDLIPSDPSSEVIDRTYIVTRELQACLCLSTLFTIRSPTNNPMVVDIPLYDSASMILQRLSDGLATIETFLLYDQDPLSLNAAIDRAMIWMYYVGALAETRLQSDWPSKHLFESRLSCKLAEKDIVCWEQLVSILRRFLYSDTFCAPHDTENWFKMVTASTVFAMHER